MWVKPFYRGRLLIGAKHIFGPANSFARFRADGSVKIWPTAPLLSDKLESVAALRSPLFVGSSHQGAVHVVRWSPSGRWLASGGEDGVVLIWARMPGGSLSFGSRSGATEQWMPCGLLKGHTLVVRDLAWHPSESFLASCSFDARVMVWRLPWCGDDGTNARDPTAGTGHAGTAGAAVARSKSARRLAAEAAAAASSGKAAPTAAVERVLLKPLLTLPDHENFVQGLAWDPHGRLLASCGEDKRVLLWRMSGFRDAESDEAAGNTDDADGEGSDSGSESDSDSDGHRSRKRRRGGDRERGSLKERCGSRARTRSRGKDAAAPSASSSISHAAASPPGGVAAELEVGLSRPHFADCAGTAVVRRLGWSPCGGMLLTPHAVAADAGFSAPIVGRPSLEICAHLTGHSMPAVVTRFAPTLHLVPDTAEHAACWRSDNSSSAPRLTLLAPIAAVGSTDGSFSVWRPAGSSGGDRDEDSGTLAERPTAVISGCFAAPVSDLSWGVAGPLPALPQSGTALLTLPSGAGYPPFLLACSLDGTLAVALFAPEELGPVAPPQAALAASGRAYGLDPGKLLETADKTASLDAAAEDDSEGRGGGGPRKRQRRDQSPSSKRPGQHGQLGALGGLLGGLIGTSGATGASGDQLVSHSDMLRWYRRIVLPWAGEKRTNTPAPHPSLLVPQVLLTTLQRLAFPGSISALAPPAKHATASSSSSGVTRPVTGDIASRQRERVVGGRRKITPVLLTADDATDSDPRDGGAGAGAAVLVTGMATSDASSKSAAQPASTIAPKPISAPAPFAAAPPASLSSLFGGASALELLMGRLGGGSGTVAAPAAPALAPLATAEVPDAAAAPSDASQGTIIDLTSSQAIEVEDGDRADAAGGAAGVPAMLAGQNDPADASDVISTRAMTADAVTSSPEEAPALPLAEDAVAIDLPHTDLSLPRAAFSGAHLCSWLGRHEAARLRRQSEGKLGASAGLGSAGSIGGASLGGILGLLAGIPATGTAAGGTGSKRRGSLGSGTAGLLQQLQQAVSLGMSLFAAPLMAVLMPQLAQQQQMAQALASGSLASGAGFGNAPRPRYSVGSLEAQAPTASELAAAGLSLHEAGLPAAGTPQMSSSPGFGRASVRFADDAIGTEPAPVSGCLLLPLPPRLLRVTCEVPGAPAAPSTASVTAGGQFTFDPCEPEHSRAQTCVTAGRAVTVDGSAGWAVQCVADGEVLWIYALPSAATLVSVIPSEAASANGNGIFHSVTPIVVVGCEDGTLHLIQFDTGSRALPPVLVGRGPVKFISWQRRESERRLLAVSCDGKLRQWRFDEQAHSSATATASADETPAPPPRPLRLVCEHALSLDDLLASAQAASGGEHTVARVSLEAIEGDDGSGAVEVRPVVLVRASTSASGAISKYAYDPLAQAWQLIDLAARTPAR